MDSKSVSGNYSATNAEKTRRGSIKSQFLPLCKYDYDLVALEERDE